MQKKVLKTAYSYGVILKNELELKTSDLKVKLSEDLTGAIEILYWKIALIHPDSSGNMQIPIKFLLYETMVKAGGMHKSRIEIDKIRFLDFRFKETIPLFNSLRLARNASVHDLNERNEIGWNINIPATVLRIIEISDFSQNYVEMIEKIKKNAVDIILYINDTSKIKTTSLENEVNENEIPKNDVSYVEEKSNENPTEIIEKLLDRVESLDNKTATIMELIKEKPNQKVLELIDDEDNERQDNENIFPTQKLLTRETPQN